MALITYSSGSGNSVSAISGTNTSPTNSWTHTGATGLYQVAILVGSITGNSTGATATASYGGTAMTALGTYNWGNANSISAFYLVRPASGSQTASVTFSVSSGLVARQTSAVVAIYNGAQKADSISSATATSTSATISETNLVPSNFAIFAHAHSGAADYLSFSRTQRVTTAATSYNRLTIGDGTNTTGSLSSTVTLSSSDDIVSLAFTLYRKADQEFFSF